MDIVEGICKLCRNKDALISDSKQIIIDLKEAFYNKINEIEGGVTDMKICLKCVVKIQFSQTFSKNCSKDIVVPCSSEECFVCADTKCILIKTTSNPSNFVDNIMTYKQFAGIQLCYDASVCLSCVYNLSAWVEVKTMLENLKLFEDCIEIVDNSPEVDGNENVPENTEDSLVSIPIEDQDMEEPQINNKEDPNLSKWSTYIRNFAKKFEPVRLLNVNMQNIKDETILNKIPYVNLTVQSQISSLSEPETIMIPDENEKPFKLSKLIQTPLQKKVTYANLCDVCDKSFKTRCEYLSHKLSHEKFEKLVVKVRRMSFEKNKTDPKIKPYVPDETLNKLLTKWLGTDVIVSPTEESTAVTTKQQKLSNPGLLSLKKHVLGEDFELLSDDDEFVPNRSNNISAEFDKLLTKDIIEVPDESNFQNKLPLTSENSSLSELESLRIEDTDEEPVRDQGNLRKRRLSDIDEASSDESPKKRAKLASDEEILPENADNIHCDEEMNTQEKKEQSSTLTDEYAEKTEVLKLSKLQRRRNTTYLETPLVISDNDGDDKEEKSASKDAETSGEGSQEVDDQEKPNSSLTKLTTAVISSDEDASECDGGNDSTPLQKKQNDKEDDQNASQSEEVDNSTSVADEQKEMSKKASISNAEDDQDASQSEEGDNSTSGLETQKEKSKKLSMSTDPDASTTQGTDDNTLTVEKLKIIQSNESMISGDEDDDASEAKDESQKKMRKDDKCNTKNKDESRSEIQNDEGDLTQTDDDRAEATTAPETSSPVKGNAKNDEDENQNAEISGHPSPSNDGKETDENEKNLTKSSNDLPEENVEDPSSHQSDKKKQGELNDVSSPSNISSENQTDNQNVEDSSISAEKSLPSKDLTKSDSGGSQTQEGIEAVPEEKIDDNENSDDSITAKKRRNTIAVDALIVLSDEEELNDDEKSKKDEEEKSVLENEQKAEVVAPSKTDQQVIQQSSSGKKWKGRKRVTLEFVDDNSSVKTSSSIEALSKPGKPRKDNSTLLRHAKSLPTPEIILDLSDPECFNDNDKILVSSDSNDSKSPILLDEKFFNDAITSRKQTVVSSDLDAPKSKSPILMEEQVFSAITQTKQPVARQAPIMTCEDLLHILDDDNADVTSGKKRALSTSVSDIAPPAKKKC